MFVSAYRQEETVRFDGWDSSLNCIEQTTEWGACSQTCGMGASTRVTNKNRRCEMVKQSRLCTIRPCADQPDRSQLAYLAPKVIFKNQKHYVTLLYSNFNHWIKQRNFLHPQRGSKCQRVVQSGTAVQLAYKNCTSIQAYKPRYCGSCTDGRCCTPHRTKTALVDFQCTNGKSTRRPVMVILTCACHSHCPRDNAVWPPSGMTHSSMRL